MASFIDKCKWDDKVCLKTSAQKAVPFLVKGIPDLGIPVLDPMNINKVKINEGGLNLVYTNSVYNGASKCQITYVERNIEENWLKLSCECPVDLTGDYKASGTAFLLPVSGQGRYSVQADNVQFNIKAAMNLVDGHWKIGSYEHTFDAKKKVKLQFENLYDGDKEKAAPIEKLLDESWKEAVQLWGRDVVHGVVDQIVVNIGKFISSVQATDLEQ